MNLLRKMDRSIMAALEWATSTKAAFYALNILIFAAVIINPPTSIQGWLLVVVSEYYQGVALPGLGAASKRAEEVSRQEGAITRQLLQETHDVSLQEFQTLKEAVESIRGLVVEIKQMHHENREESAEIRALVDEMHTKHSGLIEIVQRHVRG